MRLDMSDRAGIHQRPHIGGGFGEAIAGDAELAGRGYEAVCEFFQEVTLDENAVDADADLAGM